MQITGLTDKGIVRDENQDSLVYGYVGEKMMYAAVFDGMGGAKAGKFASTTAANIFEQSIKRADVDALAAFPSRGISSIIEDINSALFEQGSSNIDFSGMGTTCVATILFNGLGVVANVGDSRAYLIDKKSCTQLTTDHSVVQVLVEMGEISSDQAMVHPQRNVITRALGTDDDIRIDVFEADVRGKWLVLCSDGLHNYFSGEELIKYVTGYSDEKACRKLIEEACNRGGRDNISIIIINCG